MSEAELLASALTLPPNARANLARELLDSLDQDNKDALDQQEWERTVLEEVRRRKRQLDSGEVKAIPAVEALEQVRARLRARRG